MNFIQQTSRYYHQSKARRYQRTYEYRDRQGKIQWHCDVFGSCISEPTVFVAQDHGRDSFPMTAEGKFMNATYYLDDANGKRFATITRKGAGFRWKILGADENEIYRKVRAPVRLLGSLPLPGVNDPTRTADRLLILGYILDCERMLYLAA